MASITKHGRGYRAQVYVDGVRRSKVLPSKKAAQDWAARTEYEIRHSGEIQSAKPLRDLFHRYANEVSPTKRGERWEGIRLAKLGRDKIGDIAIRDLCAADLADWRDRRLQEVGPASVLREMSLIGAVLSVARLEWGLLSGNPMEGVRKPTKPAARDRLPTSDEIERLRHVAGEDLQFATARAFHAFMFAGETAMRAGEIIGLTWDRLDLEKRVAHLPMTKNGTKRDVPLSTTAVEMLEMLREHDFVNVFGLTSQQLDALWRKIRGKAGVEGLTFHDSRAWATGRLAKKVDVLTLAKITGHRNINMLMIYYRETAEEIAARLG